MDFMSGLFSGNKRLASFLIIALIVFAIPLTVFITQKQQTIRQRAQIASDSRLYFANAKDGSPIQTLSLSPNEKITLFLYFNPRKGEELNLISFNLSADNLILTPVDNLDDIKTASANKLSFEKLYTNTGVSLESSPLLLFNFTVTAGEKSGNIAITKGEIGTSTQDKTSEISSVSLSVTVNVPASTPTPTPIPTKAPASSQKIVCNLKTPTLSYDPFYGHDPNNPRVIKTDANGWPIPAVTLSWKDKDEKGNPIKYKVWGGAEGTRLLTKEDLTLPLPSGISVRQPFEQENFKQYLEDVKNGKIKIKSLTDLTSSPFVDIKIKRGEIYHYILSDTNVTNLSQCANTGDIAEGTMVVYTGSCPSNGAIFGSKETAGSDSDCKK